jgi:hypothetical protein
MLSIIAKLVCAALQLARCRQALRASAQAATVGMFLPLRSLSSTSVVHREAYGDNAPFLTTVDGHQLERRTELQRWQNPRIAAKLGRH